jgi:stage V sporulation protein G
VEITDVRITLNRGGKVRAFAQIVIDGCFLVGDIRVSEGKEGTLLVNMPSRRLRNGSFRDVAHPLNTETRRMLEATILAEYERVVAEHGEPGEDGNGRSRSQQLSARFLAQEYWTNEPTPDE